MKPEISWVWQMPNRWTFKIPAIRALIDRYVPEGGKGWAEPFAGLSTITEYRNDLNPEYGQPYSMEATEFLKSLKSPLKGVLFDPPYSMEQISRSYKGIGLKWDQKGTENLNGSFPRAKDEIARLVEPRGYVISFGWNTVGMGKKRGFEPVELLIVCHGGNRNDTLCIVESKLPIGE